VEQAYDWGIEQEYFFFGIIGVFFCVAFGALQIFQKLQVMRISLIK